MLPGQELSMGDAQGGNRGSFADLCAARGFLDRIRAFQARMNSRGIGTWQSRIKAGRHFGNFRGPGRLGKIGNARAAMQTPEGLTDC